MAKCKVLVIDDEPFNARILKLKLERAGHQVLSAPNGLRGLEVVRSERPEVVVVDIMMPVMNGREFCGLTEPLKREHPFLTVVVTSAADREHRRWAGQFTRTLFMEKPVSPSGLLEIIDSYLKGEGGRGERRSQEVA